MHDLELLEVRACRVGVQIEVPAALDDIFAAVLGDEGRWLGAVGRREVRGGDEGLNVGALGGVDGGSSYWSRGDGAGEGGEEGGDFEAHVEGKRRRCVD